ncbi:TIGR03759 family integrating conjugative element protein [Limnobaculum zhutongyuii]|uniref:TIGR03759 family integrating conjugative element protein n=1 Tax=Limnobaculum zhutongyuii TaxID=2498113 RepID=A0A411WM46_9GAMM|nr:TIGR03759 family integrating conjugative element protein [Limnobaculum zhutongyuii]QBH97217.1 TIGR03759 family integrating conjugative element protein [Limnobaculum zhutongyuii]TQS88476.1 TIGR03759 family integrating conjugative element protein [Limnobaculum zhutongyuii]
MKVKTLITGGILFILIGNSYADTTSSKKQSIKQAISTETPAIIDAQRWGLSETEWQHYQRLKDSERGIWSPGLDPLTTLGIESENEAERDKYAELLVQKEFQRVEKELAFQRAYDRAWKKLFPTLTPINSAQQFDIAGSGRLAYFTSDECPRCDSQLRSLLASGKPVDIYLVGSQNDDNRIRTWALKRGIDTHRVKNAEITLNHDDGRWLTLGQGKMPALIQKRGSEWVLVSP